MPADLEDRVLVQRLAADDTDALETALARYWPPVALFVTRLLGDREAAKDVSQETFIRLWENRHHLAPTHLRAYVFRIARNLAMDEIRRRAVRSRRVGADAAAGHVPQPDVLLEQIEMSDAIAAAVNALPPRRREAFTLAYLQDLTYQEVAQVLGISAATVKNQVAAALADLRLSLGRYARQT